MGGDAGLIILRRIVKWICGILTEPNIAESKKTIQINIKKRKKDITPEPPPPTGNYPRTATTDREPPPGISHILFPQPIQIRMIL